MMHCVDCARKVRVLERWARLSRLALPEMQRLFRGLWSFFLPRPSSMKDIVTGETIFPSLFPRRCWSARPERATVIRVSPAESEIRCKMKIAGVARPQHISD